MRICHSIFLFVLINLILMVTPLCAQSGTQEITADNAHQLQLLATLNVPYLTDEQFLPNVMPPTLMAVKVFEADVDPRVIIQFWNIDRRQMTNSFPFAARDITYRLWLLPTEARFILLSIGGGIYVGDMATGEKQTTFIAETTYLTSAALSRDGHLFAYTSCQHFDNNYGLQCDVNSWEIRLFDTHTLEMLPSLAIPGNDIRSIALSSSGQHVFVQDEYGQLSVWDVATSQRIAEQQGGCEMPYIYESVLVYSDSELIVVENTCQNYQIRLWNFETGAERILLILPTDAHSIALSPNHPLLAVQHDEQVSLINIPTGATVAQLSVEGYRVHFSADGNWLAVHGDNEVSIWGIPDE